MRLLPKRVTISNLFELETYVDQRGSVKGGILEVIECEVEDSYDEGIVRGSFSRDIEGSGEVVFSDKEGLRQPEAISDQEIALGGIYVYTRRPIEAQVWPVE